MGEPQPLSPGLQYIYTSGACAAFATALTRLAGMAGGRVVTIEDDDDRDHQAVETADGRYADAEGLRTLEQLSRSFGMRGRLRVTPVEPLAQCAHVDALVTHLLRLGWSDGPPEHDVHAALEDRFEEAKADFDELGGWSSSPIKALEADRRRTARSRRVATGRATAR